MSEPPILWSFRRCPYAIRARLAIAAAGVAVELREVDLACRPPELLEIWPRGTVPVLQGGEGLLLSESLDVMRWALARHDPGGWLRLPEPLVRATQTGATQAGDLPALPAPIAALIADNDGPFKHHLDRFKYANRHPGEDPELHRQQALAILRRWDGLIQAGGGWLLGARSCLADWALLPFVRQFQLADRQGFAAAEELGAVRAWLERYEKSPELAEAMAPPLASRQPWRSPRRLYHLALAEEWRQAQAAGVYRRSTRGLGIEEVGFIHASHADQIEGTYRRFYADAGAVRLLIIDPARLAEAGVEVREEEAAEGSGELFPHLYGPLPLSAVLAAEPYRP